MIEYIREGANMPIGISLSRRAVLDSVFAMNARTLMSARRLSARAIGVGLAAVCVLLVGFSQSADAQTKVRDPREISGLWVGYPFGLTFDPSIKLGDLNKVLLQPEYDAAYKARRAAIAKGEAEGKPLATASTLCLPLGMPGDMLGFAPLEIVVTKKTVYAFPEGWDPPRHIFMDGRSIPALDDLEPSFAGFSVGRWEGNTLVVDTAGVKINAKLEDVPHSDAMRIHERIRLLDDHTLEDVFTITDPKAFKAPWVVTKHYKDYFTLRPGQNYGLRPDQVPGELTKTAGSPGEHAEPPRAPLTINEVVCNENNRNPTDENGVVGLKLGSE